MMNYEWHEFASIFPLISDQEIAKLSEDIKKNGLLEDIWLFEGKILDGRNREKACKLVEVTPTYKNFTGLDALSFVVSKNLNRRHLTTLEKVRIIEKLISKGWSQQEASKELGISRMTFHRKTHSPSEKIVTCVTINVPGQRKKSPEQTIVQKDLDLENDGSSKQSNGSVLQERIKKCLVSLIEIRNEFGELKQFEKVFKEIDSLNL
jgi:predicted DNA-binding protein (UPF0251 family)